MFAVHGNKSLSFNVVSLKLETHTLTPEQIADGELVPAAEVRAGNMENKVSMRTVLWAMSILHTHHAHALERNVRSAFKRTGMFPLDQNIMVGRAQLHAAQIQALERPRAEEKERNLLAPKLLKEAEALLRTAKLTGEDAGATMLQLKKITNRQGVRFLLCSCLPFPSSFNTPISTRTIPS